MSKEEFISKVWEYVRKCPEEWRTGQAVFNVIDDVFGVARTVQFEDGVDCFYNDDAIESFIERAWERYQML